MLDLAVSMDCAQCTNHCCGLMPHCRPVLMPWEEPAQFFNLVDKVGKLKVVKRRKDGLCVFLDGHNRCSIYNRRPLECGLFPFKLNFGHRNVTLEVDQRCKHHALFSQLSANRLMTGLAGHKFPLVWVASYLAYEE